VKTFKLTPKQNSDYRVEVKEIKQTFKIEKFGYRIDKAIYGFAKKLTDIEVLQASGFTIEEIPYEVDQYNLTTALEERSRVKSSLDRLRIAREEKGTAKPIKEADTERQLKNLNDEIQRAKEALSITAIVKFIKF
jgi:hypothetical protein